MTLRHALLLSLALHALLLLGPGWFSARHSPAQPRIEARLLPLDDMTWEALTTHPDTPPPAPSPPRNLEGRALRSANAALSRHLFYPPEAVSRGLEGNVILLLTLADDGRLLDADVARSSGHALLDQAALDAARRIGRLNGARRQILFPVNFRLQ
jgi:protein TonB